MHLNHFIKMQLPHYYGYYQWDTKGYASIAHVHVKINILIK